MFHDGSVSGSINAGCYHPIGSPSGTENYQMERDEITFGQLLSAVALQELGYCFKLQSMTKMN